MKHIPVLLKESIEFLNIKTGGRYLDCTAGFGGHSKSIIKRIGENGELFMFDMDLESVNFLKSEFSENKNVKIFHSNFINIDFEINYFDGILMDLGISSYQIDNKDRGFSFRYNAPLDMRMNKNNDFNLLEWFSMNKIEDIAKVIEEYSDEKEALNIAKAIKKRVLQNNLKTTFDLKNAIIEGKKNHGVKYSLRRVFQAFRILVNSEMENLKIFLNKTPLLLKPEGRIVIITYHSIEDRIVKYYFKDNENYKLINKKVIKPNYKEIQLNKRARSAKLRCAERLNNG